MSPFNDNVLFLATKYSPYNLNKSADGGRSFISVNNSFGSIDNSYMLFDWDSLHIYVVTDVGNQNILMVSSSGGNPNTWTTKYSNNNKIYLTIDDSSSGSLYIADGNNIYISTDYGDSFKIFKPIDSTVVGIYKKPKLNILYSATQNDIFEITENSIQSIKHITGINEYLPSKLLSFSLGQNYPNPFNPSSTINYSIVKADLVKLTVYNVLGIKVSNVVNEFKSAGNYSVNFNAADLPSGIYFYKIEAGQFSQVKKMMLIK